MVKNVGSKYDIVMVARHDTTWTLLIDKWPEVRFDTFNFFSSCEPGAHFRESGYSPNNCVNDIFHLMNGSLFTLWDSVVGSPYCFEATVNNGNGHGCYKAVATQLTNFDDVAYVTDWRPTENVR